jgi:hypothetical protein
MRAAQAIGPGAIHRLAYRARSSGWFYVQVKLAAQGVGTYDLSIRRS